MPVFAKVVKGELVGKINRAEEEFQGTCAGRNLGLCKPSNVKESIKICELESRTLLTQIESTWGSACYLPPPLASSLLHPTHAHA